MLHRGPQNALDAFLPLNNENWITCGNALRIDWLSICPPTGTNVAINTEDLFESPHSQAEIEFENEGGETYICGNPPYLGSSLQSNEQKADLESVFGDRLKNWRSSDYVAGWFMKAADYGLHSKSIAAFVSTNTVCQGQQALLLWPLINKANHEIVFAYTSFMWSNLASNNAGVVVVIVGIAKQRIPKKTLYFVGDDGEVKAKNVDKICSYLVPGEGIQLRKNAMPINGMFQMNRGDSAVDGGGLLLTRDEFVRLQIESPQAALQFIRPFCGSEELIKSIPRYCLWISDEMASEARRTKTISDRLDLVCKNAF